MKNCIKIAFFAALTLALKDASGNDVTVKYVHLVKYTTASGTRTATAENGVYTIPADAKSVTIESALLGDTNLDGVIAPADITLVARVLAGLDSVGELQNLAANTNGDGLLSPADATKLARYLANLDVLG